MSKSKFLPPAAFRPECGAIKSGGDAHGIFVTQGKKYRAEDTNHDSEDYILCDTGTGIGHVAVVCDGHGGIACSRICGQALLKATQKRAMLNSNTFGAVSVTEASRIMCRCDVPTSFHASGMSTVMERPKLMAYC